MFISGILLNIISSILLHWTNFVTLVIVVFNAMSVIAVRRFVKVFVQVPLV